MKSQELETEEENSFENCLKLKTNSYLSSESFSSSIEESKNDKSVRFRQPRTKIKGNSFGMKSLRCDVVFKTILRSLRKYLRMEFEKNYLNEERRKLILKNREELTQALKSFANHIMQELRENKEIN